MILLSDANIQQYGIESSDLLSVMESDDRVNAFVIFMGNLGDQIDK